MPLEHTRTNFYRPYFPSSPQHSPVPASSLLPVHSRAARDVGGTISVAESLPSAPVHTIAAVLLFLPPHVRSSPLAPRILWNAGFLGAMWGYGPRGIYRILGVFGANADRMFGKALSEFGLKAEQCGFVQTIARNPEWKGERGAAGQLLQWEMKRFWRGGKSGKGVEDMGSRDLALVRVSVPVILDTSTESAMRVYERLGFRLIGECKIDTGTDGMGLKAEGKEASEQANRVCRQRFMLAMPEWTEFVLDETK